MESQPSVSVSDIITQQELDEILTKINQRDMGLSMNMVVTDTLTFEECQSIENKNPDEDFGTTGISLSTYEFPGFHEFRLIINKTEPASCSWVYSDYLKQAFIDMNKILMISFQVNSPEIGMNIRAVPVYTLKKYADTPVIRCKLHSTIDDPHGQAHIDDSCFCVDNNLAGHVVRVAAPEAKYWFNKASSRHSVTVPVVTPQPGTTCIQVPYTFACKTSCVTGMQRRPIQIIFTLEKSGVVLGRQILAVKICSCPKRDMEKIEKDKRTAESSKIPHKRSKAQDSETSSGLKKIRLVVQNNPQPQNNDKRQALLKKFDELMTEYKSLATKLEKLGSFYKNENSN